MTSMEYPNVYSRVEEYRYENKTGKVNWIMTKGLGLGTKILVTCLVVSSAPIILPPLLVISAIGVAFSVPYGVMLASYACTEKIMSKLLPRPATSPEYETLYDYDDELGSYEFQGGQGMEYQRDFNMEESEKAYIEEARDEAAMRNELVMEGIDEYGKGNTMIGKDNRKEKDENKVEYEKLYEYDREISRRDDIERKQDMEDERVLKFERGEKEARLDDMQEKFEMRDELAEEGIKKQNESDNLVAVEFDPSVVNQAGTLERNIGENENEIEYGNYLEKDEENLCEEIDMKIERVMYEEQEPLMRKSKAEQKVDNASSIYINVDTYEKPDTDIKGEYTAYEVTNIIDVELDQGSNVYARDGERDNIDLSDEKCESYGNSPKGGHESNHARRSSGRDTNMPSNEDENKIWKQINAMRRIVGYKAQKRASCIEELKALYVFTGVEPPALFKESSDLMEVADKETIPRTRIKASGVGRLSSEVRFCRRIRVSEIFQLWRIKA